MANGIELPHPDMALENERLQLALQAAGVGTWDYNLETGFAQWSAICKQLFGLPPQAPVDAAILLNQVHPDDRERVRQANLRILSPESDGEHNVLFRTISEQGQLRWVQAKGKTIRNEHGQVLRFNGVVFDITELKLAQEAQIRSAQVLEQRVAERTQALNDANRQLKKSNDSLTEFAYVASHDLQEPLRKIQAFGDLLKSQYSDQLGSGADYLERMQTASLRMSTLIKDLLTLSRLASQHEAIAQVSLSELVKAVLSDLELTIQETAAVVTIDTLPVIAGYRSQLNQLFQNLLTNALKFHPPGATPAVWVQSQIVQSDALPEAVKPTPGTTRYHRIDVVDNGIGFDQKHAGRIFQVFQRLHGKSQYVGTGIGLAICEKVVTNHDGNITATSQPGNGATFSVYLPAYESSVEPL
ncbi:sensor histidine kinase [Spirosoma fluminis]